MNLDTLVFIFVIISSAAIVYYWVITFLSLKEVVTDVIGNENFGKKDLYNIDQMIKKHNKRTRKLKKLEDVKKARLKLEQELGLSIKLKQLYKYINLYPVWYEDSKLTNHDEPFWYSTAIKPEQLKIQKLGASDFANIVDHYYLGENTEILNYEYRIFNDIYNLVYIKTFEYFKSIYIYKNKTDLVYKYNAEIQTFKPGEWILHLLQLVNTVSLDEMRQSKVTSQKMQEFNEREIKQNFLS